MPRRHAAPSVEQDSGSPTATPEPTESLYVALTELALGTVLHRVHLSEYLADQFNPGLRGKWAKGIQGAFATPLCDQAFGYTAILAAITLIMLLFESGARDRALDARCERCG